MTLDAPIGCAPTGEASARNQGEVPQNEVPVAPLAADVRLLQSKGFRCFPLVAGHKKPVHSGGFKNATLDQCATNQSFANAENIGIACGHKFGSGLVVLDFDPIPKGSRLDVDTDPVVQAVRAVFVSVLGQDKEREQWERAFKVRTPSGGLHVYFRMAPDAQLRSATGWFATASGKLDIRAGDSAGNGGGYVVGPTSHLIEVTGSDGEIKQFEGTYRIEAPDGSCHVTPLNELPVMTREMAEAVTREGQRTSLATMGASVAHNCQPPARPTHGPFSDGFEVPDYVKELSAQLKATGAPGLSAGMTSDRSTKRAGDVRDALHYSVSHSAGAFADRTAWRDGILLPLVGAVASGELPDTDGYDIYTEVSAAAGGDTSDNASQWSKSLNLARQRLDAGDPALGTKSIFDKARAAGWMPADEAQAVAEAKARVERNKAPWEAEDAQSSNLTLAGAINRFVVTRTGGRTGGLCVRDLQSAGTVSWTVPQFKQAFSQYVEGSHEVLGAILERDLSKRGQKGQQYLFNLVDDFCDDPRLPVGPVTISGRELYNKAMPVTASLAEPMADPAAGCALILKYFEVIVGHSEVDPDGFVLRWAAWVVQNIGTKSAVAIVLRGAQGTGKSTFNKVMVGLLHPHAKVFNQSAQILGQFNSALDGLLFAALEEALWTGNGKEVDGAKALITDPVMTTEAKHKAARTGPSFVNVGIASNHAAAAPVEQTDRRYAVFDMDDVGIADGLSSEEWRRLHEVDLTPGSTALAALYQYLKGYDLGEWTPRGNIPDNEARAKQRKLALRGSVALLMRDLLDGEEFPGKDEDEWRTGPVTVMGAAPKDFVLSRLEDMRLKLPVQMRTGELATGLTKTKLQKAFTKYFEAATTRGGHNGCERGWVIPKLEDCSATFDRVLNGRQTKST